MKPVIICCDRDGTINKDENDFIGSTTNWKETIELLPTVIDGIKLLNALPNTHIFIASNQAGVALTGEQFDELTEQRAHDVNTFIKEMLSAQNATIEECFLCPYVDQQYVTLSKQRKRTVNPSYIKDNHPDMKPNPGMIEKAAATLQKDMNECTLFVIGDRLTDLELALNANGIGILIPSTKTKERNDLNKAGKLKQMHPSEIYIEETFLDAAKRVQTILSN